MNDYDTLSNKLETEWISERINDFEVIVIYDRQTNHFDFNYLVQFPSDRLKENVVKDQIFSKVPSKAFIVWKQDYEENKDVFYQIRLRARKEVIIRVTEFMVAKYFTIHEHYLNPIFKSNPTLKWQFLTKLYYKYTQEIKEKIQLNDEIFWKQFMNEYKTYLVKNVLHKLLKQYGFVYINHLSTKELNTLFREILNEELLHSHHFILDCIKVVNTYIKKWITETGLINLIENNIIEDPQHLLTIDENSNSQLTFESIIRDNYFIVFSNLIYQSVLKALSNNEFKNVSDEYIVNMNTNQIKGKIKFNVEKRRDCDELLMILSKQPELTADILDLLCHLYLNNAVSNEELIEVEIDQLLKLRGIQPKLGGNGRRGGFEKEQREQILNSLHVLQNVFVEIEEIPIYERNKRIQKSISGHLFHFYRSSQRDSCHFKNEEVTSFYLEIGDVFLDYIFGSNRQVKLLPKKALTYNPYQKTIEKKIIRYLSWRFRIQARRGDYLRPLKMKTLIRQIGFERKKMSPSRYRDRLEKALDKLTDDQLIASWQYHHWDEDIVKKKNWLEEWLETSIIIIPPQPIISYYQPLERKKLIKNRKKTIVLSPTESIPEDIGRRIKKERSKRQQTLSQVANMTGISASYLSHIERGIKIPSYQIYLRLNQWLYN